MKSYKYGAYTVNVYTTKSGGYLAIVVFERHEVYTSAELKFDEALARARAWIRAQGGTA